MVFARPVTRKIRLSTLSLTVGASLLCTMAALPIAQADVKEVPESELTMTKDLSFDIHKTLFTLRYRHYSPKSLDDDYSSRIFDGYLKVLDPNKIYFTKEDIDGFEKYRNKIDDFLIRRDAEVAFEIFKVFRKRLDDRTKAVRTLIESDFDFTINEKLNIDRDSFEWKTPKQIDDEWRKRIKNDTLQQTMAKTPITEIRENLLRRYDRQRDVIFQLKGEEVFEWFMNSYTTEHGPHTTYMSHVTAENFNISITLSLQGIGAALNTDEDYTVVNRIIKGGPAEKSGSIKAEDKIVAVGQENEEMINVIGWRLNDVVQMIRGDKGTKVRLDVLAGDSAPGSPPERIELVRDIIQLEDQAAKLSYLDVPEGQGSSKYGVISIPSFYSNVRQARRGNGKLVATTRDVKKLIKEAQDNGVEGLALDLRGNGGGLLHEAISLTGLFIDQGPVVQIVGSRPNQRAVEKDLDSSIAYDGPLVVLIDRYSASASEIFAGAMQDYGRALIVGERSFGKGTVQSPEQLREGGRKSTIKYTNAQFFRISGSSTQHKGVIPDLKLNSGREDDEFGERSYDNALPWTETQAANYRAGSLPIGLVSSLSSKHQNRSNVSPAFEYLRKSSDRIFQNKEIKSISLNLEVRQAERDNREQAALSDLNTYRKSLGLEPVTSDTRKDNPLPDEDEHWNKVFHQEAAEILHDYNKHQSALVTKLTNS